MKLCGIVTVGEDAKLFYNPAGKAMGSIRGWWTHGRERKFQWVDIKVLRNAEQIVPMVTKNKRLLVFVSELHVETYEKKNSSEKGIKLVGILESFEFAERRGAEADAPPPPPHDHKKAASEPRTSFNDMDDDLPF